MNRSSWTGNAIIIPFYVLGWQPHPQLNLMKCSLQMFPKGLWFVTEKRSQCLTLRIDPVLYGLYHLRNCSIEADSPFQFIKLQLTQTSRLYLGDMIQIHASLLVYLFRG